MSDSKIPKINLVPETFPIIKLNCLFWDGRDVGEIDKHVSTSVINEVNTFMLWVDAYGLRKQIPIKIQSYKSDVPLIADELKSLFNLSLSNFLKCKYKNKDCLITQLENDVSLRNFQFPVSQSQNLMIEDIREIFAFRYLVGFKSSSESSINVRTYGYRAFAPVSIDTNSFIKSSEMYQNHYVTFDCNDSGIDNNCSISDEILNKWFYPQEQSTVDADYKRFSVYGAELLEAHVEKLVKIFYKKVGGNIDTMKSVIEKIFAKYDPKLLIWSFVIIERMMKYI